MSSILSESQAIIDEPSSVFIVFSISQKILFRSE